VLIYVGGAVALSVGLGALAVLDAEQDAPGANITTFGDALWWASTTVTTVGYGDRYPVTTEGRLVAVGLMLAGIGLVGAVTASVTAWILGRVAAERAGNA
jgi:voltage-gated potassium channel